MPLISIAGIASGKKYGPWQIPDDNDPTSLMQFLISKGNPIASSCNGDGQCLKCVNSSGIATCQISPLQFLLKHGPVVEIDYL